MKPLAGLFVVDLTRYLPGPFASRELLRLGPRSPPRRLAHARRPRARRAPARRRALPAPAHRRPRLLSDLPDGRRPLPDGRRARAEVLQPALRAARPPGAGRGPVRARPGAARRRARR